MSFQLVPLFVVHLFREYLNALQSDSTWSAEFEKKRMPAVNTALAKNGARPANISCSSLSASVLGKTSPIEL